MGARSAELRSVGILCFCGIFLVAEFCTLCLDCFGGLNEVYVKEFGAEKCLCVLCGSS